jgi:hypothetical protein
LVLGAEVAMAGGCLFDTGLFRLTNVAKKIFCVQDFASNVTVIELTVPKMMALIFSLLGQEQSLSIVGTATTLYFLRMFLTAWKCDEIHCCGVLLCGLTA